jgi:hypothetical protein
MQLTISQQKAISLQAAKLFFAANFPSLPFQKP